MAPRRIAVLAAGLAAVLGGVWLLANSPAAAERVLVQLPPPRPFSHLAEPCLIATASCLDLSPEPFAPCLIAAKPCNRDWSLYLLGLPNAEPAAQPFRLRDKFAPRDGVNGR